MAKRMTPMQVELLREINKECDDDDSSTEYMIQDAAEVSYDQVMDFLGGKYDKE